MDKFHFTNNFGSTSKNNFNGKSIDADSMINNIISQQDTFVVNNDHQFYSNLPKWMIPKSGFVHPLYEQIWQYVKSDKRDKSCDTNLVSQLLMTSGLSIDVLGGLWSMANIGVEGSLSQQELYIILALVTLVQNGYSVSNASLLQHIHKPIIPQLNYSLIEKKHNTSTIKSNNEHKLQQTTNKSNTVIKKKHLQDKTHSKIVQQQNLNLISSEDNDPLAVTFIKPRTVPPLTDKLEPKSLDFQPVNNNFESFDDEFSEFQSAQFSFTDCKNNQEFTNFQSAFDTLSLKEPTKNIENHVELLNVSSIDAISNSFDSEPNLISYQDDDIHDKYKAFRMAVETVDTKDLSNKYVIVHQNLNDLLDVSPTKNAEEKVKNDICDEEFGDFLCVEEVMNNKSETEINWKNVQVQCINKCLEFLQEGFSTLSSISDEKVLMEVINHNRGKKYLTQLNLISQICKRILKNCNYPMLEDILTDKMSKLETYLINCTQEPINNSKVLDSTNKTVQCYLCKCNCKMNSTEYKMHHFHSSCINFLVNYI